MSLWAPVRTFSSPYAICSWSAARILCKATASFQYIENYGALPLLVNQHTQVMTAFDLS
jgi:hypothetical protein